jgi:hypothetical protein
MRGGINFGFWIRDFGIFQSKIGNPKSAIIIPAYTPSRGTWF